ncbi:MAG TPA: hypothetical protein VK474_05185, partial [Chthoniobacterales bacterium]|nr:hypothetical protein [Chthoniobacterales bacterium]
MPRSPQSSVGTEGNILLVEEYDALAAAIRSVLKKFAPRHALRVVHSFRAAEELPPAPAPDLLIVDFDPPLAGALEFFDRRRKDNPLSRALIIGAGTPQDILRSRRPPIALHFIEKPFQLADFGSVVQTLLAPSLETDARESRGSLGDLNLADVLPLFCLEG